MTQDTVQQLEENILKSKEIFELNTALERLKTNRDFKKVVLEGYFRDEAVRLVHLKIDPSMQSHERQLSIMAQIDAIGGLSMYFHTVFHNAQIAAKAIQADEESRDELLNDGSTL